MVKATINKEHYACSVTNGTHEIVVDEPFNLGGTDKGFAPTGLLMASLASCVAITLRMYIDRKGWAVDKIEVGINMLIENAETLFVEEITCTGNLSVEQKARLEDIASKCPVSKILTAGHEIRSKVL
ncbi:osmotically inducible protein OsmC [Pedobacter yonginense]|uniref:Osmotically inducible protein OsmC n=1 Tax=Pedobacter yonginense TaxID=651869 RepID=A0A317ENI5_9SPHI|nr:OsmC family protein [Pedobacter yonginense]PWS26856.1 osmotically inducible protein OsmC [Pedobacter yonginense]